MAAPAWATSTSGTSSTARTPPGGYVRSARTGPTTLDTVEVRGSRNDAAIEAQQRLTPGSVNLVNGDTFFQRAVGNVADALRYVPGVSIQSNSGGDSGILSIRGSNLTALNYDNSGVMLFQDGLPVTTADGANHNRLPDPLAARNIIVANGANALTYGASELGGAIDFISRTARNSDPRQVYLTAGSHGLAGSRLSTGGVSGAFDGMLTLDGKNFSGYQAHTREHRLSVYGNAGWQASEDFRLRAFATFIDNRQQLAGSLTRAEYDAAPRQADPSYVLGNHQVNVKTGRLAARGTWNISPHRWLEFGASWEVQSLYHPIVDVYDFRFDPPLQYFSLLIDTTQRTAGGMLRYHVQSGSHDLVAGINLAHTSNAGSHYRNDAGRHGTRTDGINEHADNLTLFVLDRWAFAPHWRLVYGTQAVVTNRDLRDVELASNHERLQQATYASFNPRVGVIREFGHDSEAFASVSRVYQPPDNFALENDVRKDDATLRAMQGTSWEIGTRGATAAAPGTKSWHWNLALYYARIRNEILSVEDPTQPGNMLSRNYGKTTHAGLEALLGASFPIAAGTGRIEPLVSMSWNDFSFDSDPVFGDNRLPYAPRFTVHGEVMYRQPATGFYAGPTFDWSGSRYADMANSYRVRGYFLVGLRAGIQRDRWTLFAEARNLADRRYVNAVSVRTRAGAGARVLNPGAPRSLFVGVRLEY